MTSAWVSRSTATVLVGDQPMRPFLGDLDPELLARALNFVSRQAAPATGVLDAPDVG